MVDIKKGKTDKPATGKTLIHYFESRADLNGKLYLGYPLLYVGNESTIIDAVWISEYYGVVVFDLIEGVDSENRDEERDEIYMKITSLLSPHKKLQKRRALNVNVEVITFAPAFKGKIEHDGYFAKNQDELGGIISELEKWKYPGLFRTTMSVIQSIVSLKPMIDRSYLRNDKSKGAIIKQLEETIANLDSQQEEAIIEFTDGIQRIRGLAGSGKTIVIALKAAYIHALNPEWRIAITFNTRALKNQFYDLIELFCIQRTGKKPNFEKIHIIQAWGSPKSNGLYYEFCTNNGLEYLDYGAVKGINTGTQGSFVYVCNKALMEFRKKKIKPNGIYDVILVDEAQDLSGTFLNICFSLLGPKKRLIYAYDELQTLNEGSPLSNPQTLFGKDGNDIILGKCYRNPRPILVTAHALGFGIYRKDGLAQFFDNKKLWIDVGYSVKSGSLRENKEVVLFREEEVVHTFIEEKVPVDDIIKFGVFGNREEQAERIAYDIFLNIGEDELLHRDIIVINPMAITTKSEVGLVRQKLFSQYGIRSHLSGESSPDLFFEDDSITFTGINRAKGNEVPMVYIMNAHQCYSHPFFKDRDLIRRRNILFTAITRSKAWVRVYGIGEKMKELSDEFDMVKHHNFELHFVYPPVKQIKEMNLIRREITRKEEYKLKKESETADNILSYIKSVEEGRTSPSDYPDNIRHIIETYIQGKS